MVNLQKYFKFAYETRVKLLASILAMFSHAYIRFYSITALILNITNWALAIYILTKVNQNQIVLHYNVDFGVNLYGDSVKILIVPFVGTAVFIVNLILVNFVFKKEKFAVHLLLASAVVVNIIILISVAALNLINLR